jgi:hypothetical protein
MQVVDWEVETATARLPIESVKRPPSKAWTPLTLVMKMTI